MSFQQLGGGAGDGRGGARPAGEARARPVGQDDHVEIWYKAQVWQGLRRSHMLKCPGSLPARVFAPNSAFVGGATLRRLPGGALAWSPADPGLSPRSLQAVVRFLMLDEPIPQHDAETAALAQRWGLREPAF